MDHAHTLTLPGETVAAAGAGGWIWRAQADRLIAHDPTSGEAAAEVPLPGPVRLAGTRTHLHAVARSGELIVFDLTTGTQADPVAVSPDARPVAGPRGAWLYDPGQGTASPVGPDGRLGPPLSIGYAADLAVCGGRLWWVSAAGDLECASGARIALGVRPDKARAVACGGQLWLAVEGSFLQVAPELRRRGAVVRHELDHRSMVVGAAGGQLLAADAETVAVLDPANQLGLREIETEPLGAPVAIAGDGGVAWIVGSTAAVRLPMGAADLTRAPVGRLPVVAAA